MNAGEQVAASGVPEAYEILLDFLTRSGWQPFEVEGRMACGFQLPGRVAPLDGYAEVRADEKFVFLLLTPIVLPETLLPPLIEFTTRANFGLSVGCFAINFEEGVGQFLFKNGVDFRGEGVAVELIEVAIARAIVVMERYLPALIAVLNDGRSPAEAVTIAEG